MNEEGQKSSLVWQEWLEKNRWWVLVGMAGVGLLGLGVRYIGDLPFGTSRVGASLKKEESRVEILPMKEEPQAGAKLVVDVGGSVKQPGIYELPYGARLGEVLAAAGGLSEGADVKWVEQVMNRAEKVHDGQKIYILSSQEHESMKAGKQKGNEQGVIAGMRTTSSVSINSASEAELDQLWGIGEVTAKAIINGRPYGSVEELLSKKIIKQNVWERIKDKLSL